MKTDTTALIVAVGGVVGSLSWVGTWLSSRRESKRQDRIDPVAAVADAYKSGVEGFDTLISRLTEEISRLQREVESLTSDLAEARAELAQVRRQLATTGQENADLSAKVLHLSAALTALGGSIHVDTDGPQDHTAS